MHNGATLAAFRLQFEALYTSCVGTDTHMLLADKVSSMISLVQLAPPLSHVADADEMVGLSVIQGAMMPA